MQNCQIVGLHPGAADIHILIVSMLADAPGCIPTSLRAWIQVLQHPQFIRVIRLSLKSVLDVKALGAECLEHPVVHGLAVVRQDVVTPVIVGLGALASGVVEADFVIVGLEQGKELFVVRLIGVLVDDELMGLLGLEVRHLARNS